MYLLTLAVVEEIADINQPSTSYFPKHTETAEPVGPHLLKENPEKQIKIIQHIVGK